MVAATPPTADVPPDADADDNDPNDAEDDGVPGTT
jgi:hypothetical protein